MGGDFLQRAGDLQSRSVLPHCEGWLLGWLLGRGGKKGEQEALKAIVLSTRCDITPSPPAGHFIERQTGCCSLCLPNCELRFTLYIVFTVVPFQVVLLDTARLCRFEHPSIWAWASVERSCCVGNSPQLRVLADLLTLGNSGDVVEDFLL